MNKSAAIVDPIHESKPRIPRKSKILFLDIYCAEGPDNIIINFGYKSKRRDGMRTLVAQISPPALSAFQDILLEDQNLESVTHGGKNEIGRDAIIHAVKKLAELQEEMKVAPTERIEIKLKAKATGNHGPKGEKKGFRRPWEPME